MRIFEPSYPTPDAYVRALDSPTAVAKFKTDFAALLACDALVLILPAGNDAHAEYGIAIGRNRPAFILLPDAPGEPELMYSAPGVTITANIDELLAHLRRSPQSAESMWRRAGPDR